MKKFNTPTNSIYTLVMQHLTLLSRKISTSASDLDALSLSLSLSLSLLENFIVVYYYS